MRELCGRSELVSRLEAKLTAGRQRREVILHLKLLPYDLSNTPLLGP